MDAVETPSMSSTPKIKPYLRKMSSAKVDPRDQGQIDLSKSSFDNDRLAGLGIQDGTRSVSDVSFTNSARKKPHARTTSGASQGSHGSGSSKATQPFIHPMRQTPRPYTPLNGSANASFVNEDEANEIKDVVDDEFRPAQGYRNRRSMSIPSTPAIIPTPLSQSYTANDLGMIPKLTSTSQTNLSMKSGRSGKSSQSRKGERSGSRRNTDRSFDPPSSRTSFDRAFSYVSRKSESDPSSRDERIREARRKFEEKEAYKDRKYKQEQLKRRETDDVKREKKEEKQRRKTEEFERTRVSKSSSNQSSPKKPRKEPDPEKEQLHSRSYDETRPATLTTLPRRGAQPGVSEKTPRMTERKVRDAQSGWVRFSAWFHTRMFNCAGEQ